MWLICPIAGVGKRLQPFTYSKPKAFLKIAGKRLIDHILIKLKSSFPKGTKPGSFLHDILEHLDFTAKEPAAMKKLVADKLNEYGFE